MKGSSFIDPGDAASSCPNRFQIHHGKFDGIIRDPSPGGGLGKMLVDDGNVKGRAAHVRAYGHFVFREAADECCGDGATCRAGIDQMGGMAFGHFRSHGAAVALHNVKRDIAVFFSQAMSEMVHVLFYDRPEVSVHHGGAGPLVLPELRADLRGNRYRDAVKRTAGRVPPLSVHGGD